MAKLNDWEDKLRRCYEHDTDHPIFIALGDTVRKLDIPIEPLLDLLTAFRQDVTQNRYESFEDLLSYCRCSANPVGRLVLMIFGYRDEALFSLSDSVCTALQLTNFWQDVAIDRQRDRLYIPLSDFRKYGCTPGEWESGVMNENFRKLMKFEVERTRDLFYLGAELPSRVNRDLQLELRLVLLGGLSVLRMIERRRYDVWSRRPRLNPWGKLIVLLRGLFSSAITRPKQKTEPWDLT